MDQPKDEPRNAGNEIVSSIYLPQPRGPWEAWAPVINNLDMNLIKLFQDREIELPLDVVAEDRNGNRLFSFITTQNGFVGSAIMPPTYPLEVTVVDGKGRQRTLQFPASAPQTGDPA
jgi:hypothetical protein